MKKQKFYYFAYGSNLSLAQMLKRCPHSKYVANAKIKNHKVVCTGYSARWKGGVATIVKENNAEAWGVVYELDEDCLLKLDGYEGVKYKIYTRKKVTCYFANGKKRTVNTYIREPRKLFHSSRRYKSVILKGAKHYKLPKEYVNLLATEL